MSMSDKEACETRAPKKVSKDMKKSHKKAKMCSHPLIDKWVIHNLEILTLLLSSDAGSKNMDTSESENKDPHHEEGRGNPKYSQGYSTSR